MVPGSDSTTIAGAAAVGSFSSVTAASVSAGPVTVGSATLDPAPLPGPRVSPKCGNA